MIQAELRIATGNKQGSSIPLPQGKFLVGREEDCHLRPNSDLVSRHHCVFTVDDFSVRLRDLGSTNGTFVNGERLKGAVNLKAGDRVLIGKLDFEVMLQEGSSVLPQSASGVETVMIAGSPEASSTSTQFAMPVLDLSATMPLSASTTPVTESAPAPVMVPAGAETQMMPPAGMMPPGYGMPVGYPQQPYPQQQPYMQNPYGYPGYPPQMQMPQMQMPMGGYYGQPMGYPQMQMPMGQMMPPGYGMPQQRMPQQFPVDESSDSSPPASGSGLDVKLPEPSATGAKEPAPPAAPAAAVPGAAPAVHIPTAAADIIKQYQNRR